MKKDIVARRRLPFLSRVLLFVLPLLFLVFSAAPAVAEVPLEPGISLYTSLNPATFRNYAIDLPNCTSRFQVRISDGSGDLDLFIRRGQPFTATSYEEIIQQSDVYSDTLGTADEFIELNASTTVPIQAGRWYVAPANWNTTATGFTLATYYEVGMPVPTSQELFLTYNPVEDPSPSIVPSMAQPIAVGDTAWGGGTLTIEIGTCPCIAPVDLYFAIQIPSQYEELYMLLPDGLLYPYSHVGLVPWKSSLTTEVDEIPFGDLPRAALPSGTYYLYLVAAPAGTFDYYYLWSTFFTVTGPPVPGNIDPFIDLIVDDTVIDFGRLDSWRRNIGVGAALGVPPDHPWPVPPYTAGIGNLCTYVNGGTTYLKTLQQLPLSDPNHIDPQQYPAGMTCVYAVVADSDVDTLNFTHVLPEPMFGRGNYYTAIDIPGGMPAGTLIDNYATLSAYNATLSAYANVGQLSVQPHVRSVNSPFGPGVLVAPVEPLRTPPQEFPYVIAFSQAGAAGTTEVVPGQTLRESPNPIDSVGLQPSGTVFQVTVEEGAWSEGNARGYIWMVPVTDDFWDPRHSGGSGDPALWVGQERVGTLTSVGQALPIIWEAPDDPDVPINSTHDQRHVNPDTVPLGGVVQLEGQVQDAVNPMVNAFAAVSYPVPLDGSATDKTTISGSTGTYSCVVEWDYFDLDGQGRMHFDSISHDLEAAIELDFTAGTITGSFSGTMVTDYDPLWHQNYLEPFSCTGNYSGQVSIGTLERYVNNAGETHYKFDGEVEIHLYLVGGRTLQRYDSSLGRYVTYYAEGTEDVDVVGRIRGSTESRSLRIVWSQVINATMPQGFYLTWTNLEFPDFSP